MLLPVVGLSALHPCSRKAVMSRRSTLGIDISQYRLASVLVIWIKAPGSTMLRRLGRTILFGLLLLGKADPGFSRFK